MDLKTGWFIGGSFPEKQQAVNLHKPESFGADFRKTSLREEKRSGKNKNRCSESVSLGYPEKNKKRKVIESHFQQLFAPNMTAARLLAADSRARAAWHRASASGGAGAAADVGSPCRVARARGGGGGVEVPAAG